MSTLEELRSGINRAWDSLADGWRHLISRASGALTRFKPTRQKETLPGFPAEGGWGLLAADLYEDDDKVVVRIEAPGMEQDDFDVTVSDDVLLVRGEKHYETERREGDYRIAECAYGRFERAFPLPDHVDGSRARAKYRRGVLNIEIPKSSHQRHSIEIK